MKSGIQHALFWAGVLLCALLAGNVWPARPAAALGTGGMTEAGFPDEPPMPREMARVERYGCDLHGNVAATTENPDRGWRVVVWADYVQTESGIRNPDTAKPHDWVAWLSWRAISRTGAPGSSRTRKAEDQAEELAMKDCREWRRAVTKRIEKMAEVKKPVRQKAADRSAGRLADKRPER